MFCLGMDTLTTIEAVGTDNKDKPVEDIKIERVAVFVDPFQEAEDQLKELREKEMEKVNIATYLQLILFLSPEFQK